MSNKEILIRVNIDQHLLDIVKQQTMSYLEHILQRPKYIPLKRFSPGGLRGKKDQIADNIHGFVTSTGATFQMLQSLYLDMQKKARFILCDEHMYVYMLQ